MRIAGLVLGAGGSKRFGGRKQLARFQGSPMIQWVCRQLGQSSCLENHVVLGAYHQDISSVIPSDIRVHIHQGWQSGIGSSIAFGVNQITTDNNWDGVLITLADLPAIRSHHYEKLISEFDGETTVCAAFGNTQGVPAIFPSSHFESLRRLSGDQGAKCVILNNPGRIAVDMPEAIYDVDVRQDMTLLEARTHKA